MAGTGVRPRIITGVFIITGLVVIVSTLLTYEFGNRVLRTHGREELRRQAIAQLDQLASTVKDAETGQRGFIISGDERYLEPYHAAVEGLSGILEKLKSIEQVGAEPDDVDLIGRLTQQKLAELDLTIALRRNAGAEAAAAVVQKGEGQRLMEELRQAIARLHEQQAAGLRNDVRLSNEATRTRTLVFFLTACINLAFVAWAYERISEAVRARDIALTEAHDRAGELQQQKDLLGVTLASIGDCVLVTDKGGRIDFMNTVAEKVTGWALAEARGRPTAEIFRILNEHTREPVENPVEKVRQRGVIVGLANHTLLIRKDGSEIPIDDSGAPIRDAEGALCGVVLVFRDFSEHRQAERELREARDAAETANKAKDQFLAMLSHELRTPLTPVLATLNLWEGSEDVPEAMQPDVHMLRRSVELEARIIDDLLDLTRIARGMLSFSPENTDVHALIEFLAGLSQSEVEGKGLMLAMDLRADQHHIHTDAGRLQQVLWNILRNALKFTETGSIVIATRNNTPNKIDIVISDTGIGMSAETMSRLFVPFEQADRSQNKRYGGLGLGMAISSALVELLEGKLTATSPGVGGGSTFTLTFATTAKTATPAELEETPPLDRRKIKLLLIEDHADTARALVRLLGSRGYNITSLATVASALEVASRETFDLYLCDLGLPDGTGFDFIERIRQTRKTPAIALTGFGMQQDVERAERAGFNAHLTKPVNLHKLEATMWRILQDRQS